ncbi:hypothetical protein [Rubripirellula lacrimiformis]|nr:hypothetical protein [Rubripirellula lacrimiformis]
MLYRMAFVGCLGLVAATAQAQGHTCGPGCNGGSGGSFQEGADGTFTPNAYQQDFRARGYQPNGYPGQSYRPYPSDNFATRMPAVRTTDPTMPPSLSGAYPSRSHGAQSHHSRSHDSQSHGRQRFSQGWANSPPRQQTPRFPQSAMPRQSMGTYNDFQPMMPPSLPPTTRNHQRMDRPQFDSLPERPVRMRKQPEMLHI